MSTQPDLFESQAAERRARVRRAIDRYLARQQTAGRPARDGLFSGGLASESHSQCDPDVPKDSRKRPVDGPGGDPAPASGGPCDPGAIPGDPKPASGGHCEPLGKPGPEAAHGHEPSPQGQPGPAGQCGGAR